MTDTKQLAPLPSSPVPAIAELALRPAVPQPKRPRVPKKIRDAIDAIAWGKVRTKKAAAEKIGISREYLSRSYKNPAVIEYSNQAAARAVAMGRPRAAAVLNELHDSRSERVRLEAVKASLGAIVAPTDDARVSVSIELKAGNVIDLSELGQPEQKIVGGQVIDAKPVE